MTTSLPSSAFTSLIVFMTPSAPDSESLSEWRFSVATTSSTVISLPLWNCTPLRIVKVQVLASSEVSQDSASAGTGRPVLGSLSTSVSPQLRPVTKQTCEVHLAGSSTSVAAPPSRPSLRWPPLRGACAMTLVESSVPAAEAVSPSAAALPMNSRRLIRPKAASRLRNLR